MKHLKDILNESLKGTLKEKLKATKIGINKTVEKEISNKTINNSVVLNNAK